MKTKHLGLTDVFGLDCKGPFTAVTKEGQKGRDFPEMIVHNHPKSDDCVSEQAHCPDATVVDADGNLVCTCKDNITAKIIARQLSYLAPTSEEEMLFRPGDVYGHGQHWGVGDVFDSEYSRHFWAIRVRANYTIRETGAVETKFRYIGNTLSPYSTALLLQSIHGALRFSSLSAAAKAIEMARDVILKRPDVVALRNRIKKHQLSMPIKRCPKTVEVDWETMTPVCVRFMYEEVYVADVTNPPTNKNVFYNTVPDKKMEKELADAKAEAASNA